MSSFDVLHLTRMGQNRDFDMADGLRARIRQGVRSVTEVERHVKDAFLTGYGSDRTYLVVFSNGTKALLTAGGNEDGAGLEEQRSPRSNPRGRKAPAKRAVKRNPSVDDIRGGLGTDGSLWIVYVVDWSTGKTAPYADAYGKKSAASWMRKAKKDGHTKVWKVPARFTLDGMVPVEAVKKNPTKRTAWVDGDTTSILHSKDGHGRLFVTNIKRYLQRYVLEPKKGWYAIYLYTGTSAPGALVESLGHAGPYTSRAAAKTAGSKRFKGWSR